MIKVSKPVKEIKSLNAYGEVIDTGVVKIPSPSEAVIIHMMQALKGRKYG